MLTFLILAGGTGERFWPLSTKENPKQLLKIFSDKSLLRMSYDRISSLADSAHIFISTTAEQLENIRKEIPELLDENIIIEPMIKDTAAAILYGTTIISKIYSEATICVVTSDHIIKDEFKFREVVKQAEIEAVTNYNIVCLAINLTYPETRYTCFELDEVKLDTVCKVTHFKDKPDLETASNYYANGNIVLNTGMMVFKSNVMLDTAKRYATEYFTLISQMAMSITKNEGIKTAESVKARFALLETRTINSIIIKKASNVVAIPSNFGWNDVGNFLAIAELFEPFDEELNIIINAAVVSTDSHDNIIIADNPNMKLALMGIQNKIIVYTKDNILICEKNRAGEVKQLIKKF